MVEHIASTSFIGSEASLSLRAVPKGWRTIGLNYIERRSLYVEEFWREMMRTCHLGEAE